MDSPIPHSISAFFPAYNDEHTIEKIVRTAGEELAKVTDDFEVIVVNDGSKDGTADLLNRLSTELPYLKVIHHERNQGYGAALITGFKNATKDLIFYTDGDGQYDVREIHNLLARLGPDVDLVNGYKIQRADSWYRIVIGEIYRRVMRFVFGLSVRDVDCDFRLFRRRLLDNAQLESRSGVICVEMAAKFDRAGARLAEVPVSHYPRLHGSSQFFQLSHLTNTLRGLLHLWWTLAVVDVLSGSRVFSSAVSRKLFVAGCISAAAYAVVGLFFWTDEVFSHDWHTLVVKGLGIGLPAVLYLYGMKLAKQAALRITIGFAILFALIGTLTLPFDSTDAFFYIADGWHQQHYHQNPYSNLLREIPDIGADQIISNRWMAMNKNPWLDSPFPYGFAFAIVTRTIAWLGTGNWWLMLALFNLMNLGVHVAMGGLLWKTAKLIPGADPRLVLYLYAWNPIVLMHSLANVHNDILMAFGILAAAYFMLRGNAKWSIPVLMVAGLIKYGAFLLLPFAILMTYRSQGAKAVVKASLLSCLLLALMTGPYWVDLPHFKYELLFFQTTEPGGSLLAFAATTLRFVGRLWAPLAPVVLPASTMLRFGLMAGFLFFVLHRFAEAVRRRVTPVEMIQTWTALLFAAICIASPQFHPWYLVILTPIAVLTLHTFSAQAAVIMTATHVLAFADLRRKSIGYFAVCTLLPIAFLYWKKRRQNRSGLAFVASSH